MNKIENDFDISNIRSAFLEAQKSLLGFSREINSKLQDVKASFQINLEPIIAARESFFDFIRSSQPFLLELHKNITELPDKAKEALVVLAEQGWFLDSEMCLPHLWEFRKTIQDGDIKLAEEALINYFESRLDCIEKFIIDKYPHRAVIIKAAFKAHRNKDYELSVPVFFAQSDGICHELVQKYFFIKKDKKPETAIYVDIFSSR